MTFSPKCTSCAQPNQRHGTIYSHIDTHVIPMHHISTHGLTNSHVIQEHAHIKKHTLSASYHRMVWSYPWLSDTALHPHSFLPATSYFLLKKHETDILGIEINKHYYSYTNSMNFHNVHSIMDEEIQP